MFMKKLCYLNYLFLVIFIDIKYIILVNNICKFENMKFVNSLYIWKYTQLNIMC